MAEQWRIEPWCALRVAGLPSRVLATIRLRQSLALELELAAVERGLEQARAQAVDVMFEVVHGCTDDRLRRAALDTKRRLYGAKPLHAAVADEMMPSLPPPAQSALTSVRALEGQQAAAHEAFERAFHIERARVSASLHEVLDHPRLLGGILLSGLDQVTTARKLAAGAADDARSADGQNREAALARYVVRAAARTTPFSGFAATSLVRIDGNGVAAAANPSAGFNRGVQGAVWRSAPGLNLRHWDALLGRAAASPARYHRLRLNPLRRLTVTPEPTVVFPRAIAHASAPVGGSVEWIELGWSDTIAALAAAADGHTLEQAVSMLASADAERDTVRDALLRLVDAGLIESVHPAADPSPDGIRAAAESLEACGGFPVGPLRRVAAALDTFATAGIDDRQAIVVGISTEIGEADRRARSPVLEDVILEGVTAAHLPVRPETLRPALEPLLRLVRASACGAAHALMCAAFVDRFGLHGVCDDVGGFIVDLLRNHRFLSRLRRARDPIAWLDADLGRAVEAAAGEVVELDTALFNALDSPDTAFATALFLQWAPASDLCDPDAGRIVFNGAQAGRGKYLSRYLGSPCASARRACDAVRRRLAPAAGALPVEIAPTLALNFQVHPRLTEWSLETPWEPVSSERVLRLSELRLRFDAAAQQLRTHARPLGRDVDLVHLGFLRDAALPHPHFLLRALSPHVREDTVAERADVYNVLDRRALSRNAPLVLHRPRLEVGRLVLERARWAIPVRDVPRREGRESYTDHFRAVSRFRRAYGLPRRAFARYVASDVSGFGFIATRLYIDWESPLALPTVTRLLRGASDGYLQLTELLPDPESSWLRVDGEHHAAEFVIECETEGRS